MGTQKECTEQKHEYLLPKPDAYYDVAILRYLPKRVRNGEGQQTASEAPTKLAFTLQRCGQVDVLLIVPTRQFANKRYSFSQLQRNELQI